MLVELSIPTNNLCTSLLLMKYFTNRGSSWFGTINMSMSLLSNIKGGGCLLTNLWFLPLYATVKSSLACRFQALFDGPSSANPSAITYITSCSRLGEFSLLSEEPDLCFKLNPSQCIFCTWFYTSLSGVLYLYLKEHSLKRPIL